MADIIRLLNWNVAGAKFLETEGMAKRQEYRNRVNEDLVNCIQNLRERAPHVITLQEIVQYQKPSEKQKDPNLPPIPPTDFIDATRFPDYTYQSFPLIDNERHSHTSKFKKVENIWRKDPDWEEGTYFAQGNAIMSRKDLPLLPVWSLARSTRADRISKAVTQQTINNNHLVENVILESGLYFGDRNTEPRSALVSHFVFDRDDSLNYQEKITTVENGTEKTEYKPKPQDVFVINLHLTTLSNEREGIPEIDEKAIKIRLEQLSIIFNGIISRYNHWANSGFKMRDKQPEIMEGETIHRFKPLWILCGDFNFTPRSEEYNYIIRRNFVDSIPQKGSGTKASGFNAEASLTLDYIFAGPKFIALEDHIGTHFFKGNFVDQNTICSDHRPMFAKIPLAYK
jgi:hypothetical protein